MLRKIHFCCPIISPPFQKGPTLFENRANQSDESLTPAFSAT
jgi:acetoacetate decarboxylase